MKLYKVYCPGCGELNKDLDLTDSDGCFECDKCGTIVNCFQTKRFVHVKDDTYGFGEKNSLRNKEENTENGSGPRIVVA